MYIIHRMLGTCLQTGVRRSVKGTSIVFPFCQQWEASSRHYMQTHHTLSIRDSEPILLFNVRIDTLDFIYQTNHYQPTTLTLPIIVRLGPSVSHLFTAHQNKYDNFQRYEQHHQSRFGWGEKISNHSIQLIFSFPLLCPSKILTSNSHAGYWQPRPSHTQPTPQRWLQSHSPYSQEQHS